MTFETIKVAYNGSIATVTLHRPEVMNALNPVMAQELAYVMDEIQNNESARCVVLEGSGDHFAAGGDVAYFKAMIEEEKGVESVVTPAIQNVHHSIECMRRMDKPILGSLQGAVAGFGVSLMLACDLVIAADTTYLSLAYTQLGLSTDGGVTYHLPRVVGLRKAAELIFMNERIKAPELKELGLVNWVVESTLLKAETQKYAEHLATSATCALSHVKGLLRESFQHTLHDQLLLEQQAFIATAKTHDFKEGVKSFLLKQKPHFEGD